MNERIGMWADELMALGVRLLSDDNRCVVRDDHGRAWAVLHAYRRGVCRHVRVDAGALAEAKSAEEAAELALAAWDEGDPVDTPWLPTPSEMIIIIRQMTARGTATPGVRKSDFFRMSLGIFRKSPGYAKALASRGEAEAERDARDKACDATCALASVANEMFPPGAPS